MGTTDSSSIISLSYQLRDVYELQGHLARKLYDLTVRAEERAERAESKGSREQRE